MPFSLIQVFCIGGMICRSSLLLMLFFIVLLWGPKWPLLITILGEDNVSRGSY